MAEQKKPIILCVDDNKQNLDLLEALLLPQGYSLRFAVSGKDALKQIATEIPDLILLDIMMPEMDGFQVCNLLRENPDHASLPIIMLTAKDKESDIVQALDYGADDYVTKPFNAAELLTKVGKLLSMAKSGKLPSQLFSKKQDPGNGKKINREKEKLS